MNALVYIVLAIQFAGAAFGGLIGVYYGEFAVSLITPDKLERIISCVEY